MKYESIAEVYAANDRIRERLKALIGSLSEEQLNALPEGEPWSIKMMVEHLAIVEDGMVRISNKLLNAAKAAGASSDGSAKLSSHFVEQIAGWGDRKIKAPEIVEPTGGISVEESFAKMDASRVKLAELRPLFDSVECTDFKFPHPAFGDLTAHDWLALLGGHEHRHIKQIERLVEVLSLKS